MGVPVRLYRLYLGEYAREGRAVAMQESGEEPLQISPAGLGVGLMQQALSWQATYRPNPKLLSLDLYAAALHTDCRWHPAYQIACYLTFCEEHKDMQLSERLRLYHYGHPTALDPDDYVPKVMGFYSKLGIDVEMLAA